MFALVLNRLGPFVVFVSPQGCDMAHLLFLPVKRDSPFTCQMLTSAEGKRIKT